MRKKWTIGVVCITGCVLLGISGVLGINAYRQTVTRNSQVSVSSPPTSTSMLQSSRATSSSSSQVETASGLSESSTSASSEAHVPETTTSAYPDLSQYGDLVVHVSIAEQTLTITSGQETIFNTTVSTGAADSPTPTGSFVIEPERGDFFYNAESEEGAFYWVSFKDHGIYLFHSIPTDEQGNEIPEEAAKLGTPSSHGCVRMKREVAKWFYENIPEGVLVTIS